MDTTAPSFLSKLASNLQVSRAAIKSQTSSNFGHIHSLTLELPALECRKKNPVDSVAPSVFDWFFFKLAGKQDRHKISDKFDFGPDWTTHFRVTCPWVPGKFVP